MTKLLVNGIEIECELDCHADRSSISKEFAKKLNVETIGKTTVVGVAVTDLEQCMVTFALDKKAKSFQVNIQEHITSPVTIGMDVINFFNLIKINIFKNYLDDELEKLIFQNLSKRKLPTNAKLKIKLKKMVYKRQYATIQL